MRLFCAGDTHGNLKFWTDYLLPNAGRVKADAIIQVGDFGFWEHDLSGVQFLDELNDAVENYGLIIHALHGNHDNWSLVMKRYGHQRDDDGFVIVRPWIRYIPQGHIWTWDGLRMRAFGGAYSIDKDWRLALEAKRQKAAETKEFYRQRAGLPPQPVPSTAGTLWWADEEMTDAEFAQLMIDDAQPVDVIFSHDKPRRANPGMDLKNIPGCHPNQDRLQLALDTLRPRFWLHGHLHHHYQDNVPVGDAWPQRKCVVVGLSCDNDAAPIRWRPTDSWCVLETHNDRPPTVVFPPDMSRVVLESA